MYYVLHSPCAVLSSHRPENVEGLDSTIGHSGRTLQVSKGQDYGSCGFVLVGHSHAEVSKAL